MGTPCFFVVDIVTFFYPIGNTSAVHLTRSLPPKQPADILLLGCGDVRNILFTVYADQDSSRKLDVTCCDIQPAIIARNILLLTLILDDANGLNNTSMWNIYYHLYLDDSSLKLLSAQATKLHALAASMQSWHGGKYGRQLRFCDYGTLTKVRGIWDTYRITHLNSVDRERYLQRSKAAMRRAMDKRAYFSGGTSLVLSGIRSAAPAGICAITDAPKLHQYYWDHGSTDREGDSLLKSKTPNPMFVTDMSTLHYGTDPLLGFHLATAYTPLTEQSPLRSKVMTQNSSFFKVVEAARLQFRSWAKSLRQCSSQNLTVRFFTGDAIAFSYALQQRRITRSDKATGIYRDPYHLEPLVLDSKDYTESGGAPLSFAVIDTSNLIDHIGAMNLLIATAPLLDNRSSASLYTESLVKREETYTAYVDSLLNGHFPTISTLLGLFPVEYWTNASASSTMDDLMIGSGLIAAGSDASITQMHVRLTWKRTMPEQTSQSPAFQLQVDETGCARILHEVYLNMFRHENVQRLFSNINVHTLSNNSLVRYHRGSFALFLRFIRSRVVVDWRKVMNSLLGLIETDSSLLIGRNYMQELYLYLHVFKVHSVDNLSRPFNQNHSTSVAKGLKSWKNIPPVLCITLKVPREKLGVITNLKPTEIGSPIVHCIIQSPPTSTSGRWQNIFSVVQLSFGDISTSGTKNSDTFRVHVAEDELRWSGSSSLFVSFRAPTWMLLLEPQTATVAFGIQSTPDSIRAFMKPLGFQMNIYETTLGHEENVFITKDQPNQPESASLCAFSDGKPGNSASPNQIARTIITGNVDHSTARIVSLTGRLEILSENVKLALKGGGKVETVQISPCAFIETVGPKALRMALEFPAPVLELKSKTRIARKSSYIEVQAPLAGVTDWKFFPSFIYPIFLELGTPVVWNMPHLNLECLPVINTAKKNELQWLITHTSGMFSSRERELRDKPTPSDSEKDVRVSFKDSLFSALMHFTGLQGQQARLFGLNNPTGGGVHILIFVSSLKLDVANHTVVLDSAVLPLTDRLMPRLHSFLTALSATGLCSIKVDADELQLWKQVLPAMVERSRTWEHRPDCEYLTESRIPLSVENGQKLLCSCGNGQLPTKFITGVPQWGSVSKYFVRAALSPCFPAPFSEQLIDFNSIGRDKSRNGAGLLMCRQCRKTSYCSAERQRADWNKHKINCGC
ncbi:hypothetical protein K432DRAFT_461196 [Lepidopterella palustris CBS 459.81]|uniref:MYND-type domain-containing protein n=1 Tax=Lepidopterella palustris CBS 459.81 TaxID=1314670 RepID=A0A8E2E4X8_9PEZI|nr:hypothetical protein K432DRAFT_461196 [Lepidopterella palustris CBS 459.81]